MRETERVRIVVNGEPRTVASGLDVLRLLGELGLDPAHVAVELDRRIVPKPDWAGTPVHDGARIEVVQFVGGG